MTATSRPWYRGLSSCLYAPSCSSSTTTRPRSGTGAKTAERAPTTTRASPSRIRHHWSCRSPAESSLWRTDTVAPKRAVAARTSIGVRPISGTRTIAPRPRASADSMARK